MFSKKYTDRGITLAFIKSLNVNAFPCGRRRSTPYNGTNEDDSRIPYDPEARLNTEANNRKHSSLNGFTQTYLRHWDTKQLSLVLGGYLFDITLDNNTSIDSFVDDFTSISKEIKKDIDHIYANILIDNTKLFENIDAGLIYYTDVLDSWTSAEANDNSALDLLIDSLLADLTDNNNYYFSSLAFSSVPIATKLKELNTYSTRDEYTTKENKKIISLCILDKVDDVWKVHEPARLPKIEHGAIEDSVAINILSVSKIEAAEAAVSKLEVPHKTEGSSTVINEDGIDAPYLHAEALEADGIAVGNEINITDVEKNSITTIGEDISTKNTITADQNLYQKLNSTTTWKVPVIQLVNGQLQISNIGKKE